MGALSGVDAEVARLARAMESYADAAAPLRVLLRDVAVDDAVPAPAAATVQAALTRLERRVGDLAAQAADAAAVLRVVETEADDTTHRVTRRVSDDGTDR